LKREGLERLAISTKLQAGKQGVLAAAKRLGLFSFSGRSPMRGNRLLILCYHGISGDEENYYQPGMFLPTQVFERRMRMLKDCRANVLDLGEALKLGAQGRLPPRSTVLTFDDGWADFRSNAYPILQRYEFPATVYLTTYYCFYNRPIFRFAVGYLLWKRRTEVVENNVFPFLPRQVDLRSEENRTALVSQLDRYAKQHELSGKQKDDLAAEVADLLQLDYEALLQRRFFHLMNPAEVAEIAKSGMNIQLHTHRHRTPLDRYNFVEEIRQNRRLIQELTGNTRCIHFCYPSGANRPEFLPWLREAAVESATTCVPGFHTRTGNELLLPRLLDHCAKSENEFESWVTGFAVIVPRRHVASLDVAPE